MLGFARVLSVKGKVVAGSSLQQALASSAYAVSSVRLESGKPDHLEEHGFESTTIADILKSKGKKADGSWLFCKTDDTVYDAVKSLSRPSSFPGRPYYTEQSIYTYHKFSKGVQDKICKILFACNSDAATKP